MTASNYEKIKILYEAKALVSMAVKAGWMTYPKGTTMAEDGSPIVAMDYEEEHEVISREHSDNNCRKAYQLQSSGMTNDQVAKACGVARGSVAYIISRGHELYLKQQRANDSAIVSDHGRK